MLSPLNLEPNLPLGFYFTILNRVDRMMLHVAAIRQSYGEACRKSFRSLGRGITSTQRDPNP